MMFPAPRPFLLGLPLALGLTLVAGCYRMGVATRPAGTALVKSSGTDEALEAAREILRKEVGFKACRNAVQKLNTFASRHPERRPEPLTDEGRDLLTNQIGLQDDELAEVGSTTFTLLDAYYLDECFLMRDAVRSLSLYDTPPLQQAERVFAWVTRQVRLQDGDREPAPPAFVLRRGWGTALERALVFLDLVSQLGLDGGVVTLPGDAGRGLSRFWLAGVLVDKKVYLFDTRLGLPLPGPDGQGTATLAEIRAHADPFRPLALDDKHRYDVTPVEARTAEISLGWSLSALAPRMKFLEAELQPQNKVALSKDPAATLKHFKEAAGPDVPVRVAARFGDRTNPLRLLRAFLPAGEGGTDTDDRKLRAEQALIPFQALPQPLKRIPSTIKLGSVTLVNLGPVAFTRLFMEFPVPTLRKDDVLKDTQNPKEFMNRSRQGGDPQKGRDNRDDLRQRLVDYLVSGLQNSPPRFEHFLLAARSPRDDVLRGRYEEATIKLMEGKEQVALQKGLAGGRDLSEKVRRWGQEFLETLQDAEAAQNQNPPAADRLEAAKRKLNELWTGNLLAGEGDESKEVSRNPDRIPPWLLAVLGAAAAPLGEEGAYLLALCKHEQAERTQARSDRGQKNSNPVEAWKTADDWWDEYLKAYPRGNAAPAARLCRARVKEALHEPAAAAALLQAGAVSPLEETGRLYRAKRVSEKK